MTISDADGQAISELRSIPGNDAVRAAFDALVDAARIDARYEMVALDQGKFGALGYRGPGVPRFDCIPNKNSLLFYCGNPPGAAPGEARVAQLKAAGLKSRLNRAAQVQVQIYDEDDARGVLSHCVEPFVPRTTAAVTAERAPDKRTDGPADWTDEELRAAVQGYRRMQELDRLGHSSYKREIYRELADRFGRTAKSFEFRMQNISAVLALMGRSWLHGLKPAAHVGPRIAVRIEALIHEVDGIQATPVVESTIRISDRLKQSQTVSPPGSKTPVRTATTTTTYVRDDAVKAWVLQRAGGKCECCGEAAPFFTTLGIPFLEVHHLRNLADDGSDTVNNAAAVCPNCHRAMHYSRDADALRQRTIDSVAELHTE